MEAARHLGKVAIIATLAFFGYTVLGIRDSAGLSVIVLGSIAAVYGISWWVKRSGGVSRVIGSGVELFSPQQVPDFGIAPPDFSQKPSLEDFNPNAALYDPNTYYQHFLANQTDPTDADNQLQTTGLLPYQQQSSSPLPQITNAVSTPAPGASTPWPGQDMSTPNLASLYQTGAFNPSTSMPPLLPRTNMKQLLLGQNVSVDIATMCVNSVILEPVRRGRDSLLRLMSEEFARLQQPLLFIDTTDAFPSLAAEFPFGHIAMSPSPTRPLPNTGKRLPTFGISKNEAMRLGQELLYNGWQVFFRFDSYASKEEAAEILTLILRGMDAWEAQRRARSGVLHCFIIIADAYRLFPDDPMHSVIGDANAAAGFYREVLQYMSGAMGMHFVLGTRKISGMDSETLQLFPSWLIKWPNDQEARWASAYVQVPPAQIMSVPSDQVLVCDLHNRSAFPFRNRESSSFHEETTGHLQTTYTFPLLTMPEPSSEENPPSPFQQR